MEYRLYTFGHFQLSSIQQGIQAGHAAVRLVDSYRYPQMDFGDEEEYRKMCDMVHEWVTKHETFVCKNGGNSESLAEIQAFLSRPDSTYPWASFYESEEAMQGLLTCLAVILPSKIYEDGIKYIKDRSIVWNKDRKTGEVIFTHDNSFEVVDTFTDFEFEALRLVQMPLAR
jgi:hypothetical protein